MHGSWSIPLPGGLLESAGWAMISSQNIDVKELTAIILSTNDLAWRRASPLGRAAADRGWERDLTKDCRRCGDVS